MADYGINSPTDESFQQPSSDNRWFGHALVPVVLFDPSTELNSLPDICLVALNRFERSRHCGDGNRMSRHDRPALMNRHLVFRQQDGEVPAPGAARCCPRHTHRIYRPPHHPTLSEIRFETCIFEDTAAHCLRVGLPRRGPARFDVVGSPPATRHGLTLTTSHIGSWQHHT